MAPVQRATSVPGFLPAIGDVSPKESAVLHQTPGRPLQDAASRPSGASPLRVRQRLDATLAPSMLSLRLNRQNLLNNAMMSNHSKTLPHFTLEKPRRSLKNHKEQLPPLEEETLRRLSRKLSVSSRKSLLKELEPEDMLVQQLSARRGTVVLPNRGSRVARASRLSLLSEGSLEAIDEASPDTSDNEDDGAGLSDTTDEVQVSRVLNSRLFGCLFRCMQNQDGSLARERIRKCLSTLGYKTLDNKVVEECLAVIPGDEPLTLVGFAKVIGAFSNRQRMAYRDCFAEIDYQNTGFISLKDFRWVLRNFGFAMSPVAVTELLEEAGVKHAVMMDWDQFQVALTAVHESYGLSSTEVAEAVALFEKHNRSGSGCLNDDELANVMAGLGRPVDVDQAKATVADFDMDENGMLDKLEFLLAVRHWRNEEVAQVQDLFAKHTKNADGVMAVSALVPLLEQLGYTVRPEVVDEGIKAVKAHSTGLMFEEVLHLLQNLRKNECFSAQERAGYIAAFERFDKFGKGHIRPFELGRVLSWLGYPHTRHHQAELWTRVDEDRSGFLEPGEFLKLIRLCREEEARAGREVLKDSGKGPLGETEVRNMLYSLGYAPSEDVLQEAMSLCLDPYRASNLHEILAFLQHIRDMQVVSLRRHEGLPDRMVNRINTRFSRHFTSSKKEIKAQDLESLLHQLFPTLRLSELDSQCLTAFVAEEGHKISGLQDLYAMVRRFVEQRDERNWEREVQVAKAAGFTNAQVAVFREVFAMIDINSDGYLDDEDIRVAFEESSAQRMLKGKRFLKFLTKEHCTQCVDFPFFLQIVKLALD